MTSTTFTNTDDNYYELGQEFKKLASLVPTIPKDECLSELEFIEIVIAYIRQLQQLLSHDQWSECLNKLASSMKNSLLSSTSSPPSSPHATNLLNQLIHESPRTQTNENSTIIRRSPLATINLDNTRLSKSVNDELDNEKIPCEFCNDQINVNDWNSHAEQCADAHRRRIENLKNGIDNEPMNILVPCEYCNKQISVQDLEWHTRQCDDEYQRQRQILQNNETDFISCEYCNAQVSIVEWELHVKRCRRKETSSTFQPNALHDEVFGVIHTFPKHWDLSSLDNLTRYILDHTTEEYKFVANKFHKTLPSNHIIQIERIQNRRWYRQYDAHKEDFIERYGQSTERWLFHGCRKSESAEAIIRDCFNRSHAVNCAVGQGIYFATQAMISHGYTQPDANRLRHMFMARVLIGRTTGGSPSTRICPPGFDTTGGENVFVTYHDAQAYGEYLIVYK
ncbi:unnamed protein product [Rotaria sp. Silwood1]|nr:unnamed protein product [Rotaria sp. Silwood1]